MMKQEKDFDNILDECLEQLLNGEKTVEQCLDGYPDEAAELEPLLRTAMATREALDIAPSPEFRERARYRFQAAIRETEPRRSRLFGWQPRWATALAVVLVLLLASSGTVAASSDSMPDEPLYQVKLATEEVRLGLTFSSIDKAELYLELADERVAEIVAMASQGKAAKVEQAAARLSEQLVAMASLDIDDDGGDANEEAAMLALEAPQAAVTEETEEAPMMMSVPEAALALAPTEETVAEAEAADEPSVTTAPDEAAPYQMRSGRMKDYATDAAAEEETAPATAVPQATTPPGAGWGAAGGGNGEGNASSKQAQLRQSLSEQAIQNEETLRGLLDNVPESARPALEEAIEMAGNGYRQALSNLD